MVAEPSRDVAPSGSPRLRSDSRADRLSESPTTVSSESGKEELLSLLTREHLDHASFAGLRQLAERFVDGALGLLFPHFAARTRAGRDELAGELAALGRLLQQALAAPDPSADREPARGAAIEHLYSRLGPIREALLLDAQAIYEGDPAAESVDQVMLAYPGFLATATYRIAHELHGRVALFPRLLTEVAHRATGIDIHPGAQIGASFAIDHGTGIVIGETAVLGARVRLYQGVTLGAARVNKRMESIKRHPTIGDEVVIYANATILGGETMIGRGSRIGGNVWLTRSVPPYSVVMPTARVERRGGDSSPSDDLIEFNI
jgi:serine O-acetyltransferase